MTMLLTAVSGLLLAATPAAADLGGAGMIGKPAPEFALKDFRGRAWSTKDFADKPYLVVAFLGVECPLAKQYAPRLEEIGKAYADKGVQIVAIDSNQQDSVTEIDHYVRIHGVHFPMLKDVGNVVADQFQAERTPEVFLLDADRVVRYHGRVDDQYGFKTGGGYAQPTVKSHDLTRAIDELIAGKAVSVPTTHADGCWIGRVRTPDENSEVTYSKQIARILQNRCESCHRPGEIGPFALQSYDEVAGWAEMIEEVVLDQRMPPWHADAKYGHWANDARMTDEEKELIKSWVAHGAPQGDPQDLPEPKDFPVGWQIGEPDQVVAMSEEPFQVAAEGTIDYQYFTVDPGFTEDKWIQAAECRPGNHSVVHHIIVFVQPPGVKAQMFEGGPANLSLLQGEAPGMPPIQLPEGVAFFVPAGSKFVFQLHYTANGSPAEDISKIGLIFADAKSVKHEARTMNAGDPFFEIPPHASNHPVKADFRFWTDTTLISLMPHMHLRGKSFRYTLQYPDGKEEILLDIPRYDFNWQNMYFFADKKVAPAGSVLKCVAHFDNSEENLANPDPSVAVRWGEQTWEEMMLGWFTCTTDSEESSGNARTKAFLTAAEKGPIKPDLQANIATLGTFRSSVDFKRYARMLRMYTPQIDRVCVSMVDGSELRFVHVSQRPVWNGRLGAEEYRVPLGQSALAIWIETGKEVVNPHLSAIQGEDITRLSSIMKSSYHVPITIEGRPALMSYWSTEEDAFPVQAQEVLANFTKLAAKNAKLPQETASADGGTTVSER